MRFSQGKRPINESKARNTIPAQNTQTNYHNYHQLFFEKFIRKNVLRPKILTHIIKQGKNTHKFPLEILLLCLYLFLFSMPGLLGTDEP